MKKELGPSVQLLTGTYYVDFQSYNDFFMKSPIIFRFVLKNSLPVNLLNGTYVKHDSI